MLTKKQLQELKKYIEDVEVKIDGEWGNCRSAEELIADGEMPDIYSVITAMVTAE